MGPHYVPRFMLGRGQAGCWHAVSFRWKAGVVVTAGIAGRSVSAVIRVGVTDVCGEHCSLEEKVFLKNTKVTVQFR